MTNRERMLAVLNYEDYDRLPIVHFGFWGETLQKWHEEGHLTYEESTTWGDGNLTDRVISKKLGFDHNWSTCAGAQSRVFPGFEPKVLREREDGSREVLNAEGMVVLESPGAGSIPAEIDYTLKGRKEWEEEYKPRLQWTENRIDREALRSLPGPHERETPLGIFCGSLFGQIRNWVGVEAISYLYMDDFELYKEMIDTVGELSYQAVKNTLETGTVFDFGHFWEDICFKNGPLVIPSVFEELVGPHYKRITSLLNENGVNIVSLDCDGKIDALVPIWLENGVNTMFPIEVGTWDANIAPWREQYGNELRGVGGMNKTVFAKDRAAIDAEVERLKPLVELGGFIPCPDHRIAPDAEWDNVRYYCDRMREVFS
jgi:hypothetical protein